MPELNEQLDRIAQLRAQGRAQEEALYAARIALRKAEQQRDRARLTQLPGGRGREPRQPVPEGAQSIDREIARLKEEIDRRKQDSNRISGELATAIGSIYVAQDPHPRAPLARLDDQIPFLLLPVRIETIFARVTPPRGDTHTELQVRVFPDDIFVHTHEATLTDREVDAGQLYWVELAVAAHLHSSREQRQKDAWSHIVTLFGGQRAAWIVRQTKPTDWDALSGAGHTQSLIQFLQSADATFFTKLLALFMPAPARATLTQAIGADDGDAFFALAQNQDWGERINTAARTQITGFPAFDLTRTDAWSRAPRTRVLPDGFVLLLYPTENAAPQEITGALIPDTVFLGPDPLDPDLTLVVEDNARTLDGDCRWMADIDTAVTQGLGFRVPLTEPQADTGFARVMVLGLRLSAGAAHGAEMLEELISNHQFSPKGFSLVPQGTPTNNTERDGSGYSDNDPYDDLAFYSGIDPPAFDPAAADPSLSQTDGRQLADALGIAYSALQTVPHANQTDMLEARAMNTALFPATLGYWLKNWMAPVVTPLAARLTRTHFTRHVTGRGPLPAVRVGNQPYGVLITSDLSRWKYPGGSGLAGVILRDELTPWLRDLHALLLKLEARWTSMLSDVAWVGKPGTDSSNMLMKMLGLHPTSVELYQRIGFPQSYLKELQSFLKPGSVNANELASLAVAPATVRLELRNLGVERDFGTIAKMGAMQMLWQHYVTALDVPNLVEDRPPSEATTLAVNYIDWLAKAENADQIVREQFPGRKPAALLYLMIRNALLLQLYHGTYEWLEQRSVFEPALKQALQSTPIAGVRASSAVVSKFELMAVPVQTVQADHPAPGITVADWIWNGPPAAEVEAAFAQEQRAALTVLAKAPAARLERCLLEHLDCCQYRLDAWETGLVAHRLEAQRRVGASDEQRQKGLYLGAFGWVEQVKRSPRTSLRREELPASLRPADNSPLFEEDEVPGTARMQTGSRRGGFTHGPSINHAAASALLRNAYLTHANSAQADALSNNLSSDRVRRAQFVLEGMRNGQPIEALLGYQFERALHDRTSESAARGDVPVLELNEFIQPYRTAFPFVSQEIPQAGTGPASESVPPYSVVNGLALAQATLNLANGFGLASVLTAPERPNANQGAAIVATQASLIESLDAVNDLLMAENAYQLVQGNFDRVAAVSLAQKDARIPPALEVLNTPRGTELTFTNRVTLHFDDLDPALAASNPWPAIDLTPRALAEPGLNAWFSTVLGSKPQNVKCTVWHVAAGSDAPLDPQTVSLADLEVQPVDFVALTNISANESQGGATEIETRVAGFYRRANALGLDATLRIDFDAVVAAPDLSFGMLFPLARHLRSLLGECRPLTAQDFLPAAGGKASTLVIDKNNPGGIDVPELEARAQAALDALTALADSVDALAPPGATTLTAVDAKTLSNALSGIALFGVSDAFAAETDFTQESERTALLSRAQRVAARLRRADSKDGVLDQAATLIAAATPDKPLSDRATSLLQAAQTLFSNTLKVLPRFACYNEAELAAADAARGQLLSHALGASPGLTAATLVDEWVQGLSRVRPRLHTWESLRTLADALNDVSLGLKPVQVPFRNEDRWLATVFPDTDPLDATKPFGISRDTLSIAAHGASAFKAGRPQLGVLLDEWTEEIPKASENTGISFRFNQPNAVPPQALLLAVTPEETGSWSWDALVGIVNDTLARAKRRAVEPAQLEKQGLVWNALAPALVSEFSMLWQADVSLDYMVALKYQVLDSLYTTLQKS